MTYSKDVIALNPELIKEMPVVPASKYRNAQAEAHGMRFDSGKEAAGVSNLILLEKQRKVFALRLQVRFPLAGNTIYVADAVYLTLGENGLEIVVWDSKGFETPIWKIKRKLFKERYGIDITTI